MDPSVLKLRALRMARRVSLKKLGGSPTVPGPILDDEVTPPEFLGSVGRISQAGASQGEPLLVEKPKGPKKGPSKPQILSAVVVLLGALISYLQSL